MRVIRILFAAAAAAGVASAATVAMGDMPPPKPAGAIRVASFNLNLARRNAGDVITDFRSLPDGENAARINAIVEIVQRTAPDILVVSELDYDPAGEALGLFITELALGRNGAAGQSYAHSFTAPVNTGLATGFDLDGDGKDYGPADAQGWGVFEGQFGMAVLSRLPLDAEASRQFQTLLWRDAPWAEAPMRADGAPFYTEAAWSIQRLSSKSHWDVAARLPSGEALHLLVSHPTPPVFDGDEDRNGLRNAAEIRFWFDYLNGADWITDDAGAVGGLEDQALFVLFGDLNADPIDGEGRHDAIAALLAHPRLQDPEPASAGGAVASSAQAGRNLAHQGEPRLDTADWKDDGRGAPGNLRVDYVLPSAGFEILGAGVFWPAPDDPQAGLVAADERGRPVGSDHRLVWVDIRAPR